MNRNSRIHNVPEGYFEQLQSRLASIPAQQKQPVKVVSVFNKVKPYAALAASFVLAFCMGSLILGRSSNPVKEEITFEDICYADLIPVTDPYMVYYDSPDMVEDEQQATEDDVLEYLISSNASVDYIAYLLNE